MLTGSFPGTLTFRFLRYFSSILYGCRAPVFKSKVIIKDGPMPACSFGMGVGLSDDGPIAGAVCCRTRDVGDDVAEIGKPFVGGEDDSARVLG